MPTTNPWLAGPPPTKQLERLELEDRILNLLSCHNMGVLATSGEDGAHAAPVNYYPLGFEILFTTTMNSQKIKNLAADPRVSFGIFAPWVGQASSRGAQFFGTARILVRDHPGAHHYWEAFRWQSDHVERSLPLSHPPQDPLVVVTPHKIVYTEQWLRKSGFAPRQVWEPLQPQIHTPS